LSLREGSGISANKGGTDAFYEKQKDNIYILSKIINHHNKGTAAKERGVIHEQVW